jgi:spoIIIJ-associated protein
VEGIEIEGKTIDDAIEKACGKFQVPREKLNIEIIAEGNPGFLGLGAKKARIRAGLLSLEMALDAVFSLSETPAPPRMERFAAAAPQVNAANGRVKPTLQAPKAHPTAHSVSKQQTTKAAPPAEHRTAAKQHFVTATAVVENGEPAAERARRLLDGLLSRMQIASPVSVEETEEMIILNIQGDGSGLLIGKRGQNLDALQYILNKAIHRSANGHKMIVIDTEKYRKRREESLVALALRLGEKVKKTKKPVTVGHMNAHDRRIIHVAVQNDETLTTKSRGEGEYRKILILPARCVPDQADA